MTYTDSFHHGTEVVPEHNRRIRKGEAHIDPNGKFEIWKDEKLADAYDRIFGEALQEYNAKQKRADRKIKSYLQNVRQNSKLNECYEFIAQVGNEKKHPDEQTCHDILKAYFEGFSARNPGLEVIGGYYHADEIGGCPHLHTDYIPTAPNKKTGLKLKNNLTEALKKLGYETEYVEDTDRGINPKTGKPYTKMVSAEMKFQEAEREALTEICRQFGIEIENPKRAKEEYCTSEQLRQARDVRMQNEVRSLELSDREQKVQEREAEASKILEQKKEVEAEKQSFEASKKVAEDYIKEVDEEVKPLPELKKISNIGTAERLEKNFPTNKTGAFSKETPYEYGSRMTNDLYDWFRNKFYNPLKDKCNKLITALKALKQENKLQKDRIDTLERENKALNQSVDKIVDDRLKSRSEALVERAKAEAEAPLKERLNIFDNFLKGTQTTFTIDGGKYTCFNGVKTIKNVFIELDDLESITPTGLKNLAKICEARGFETVGDAKEYQKKHNLESVFDISDKQQSYGRSM